MAQQLNSTAAATQLMDFSLYLMTWNVKGRPPVEDLHEALGLEDPVDVSNLPDMYAIGLQEVSLNLVSGMLFLEPWHDAFRNILTKWNYIKVKQVRLQGILLMLYCKQEHLTHIRGVQTDLTRTGFGGVWGNKGGVSIRFSAYGCSMCIVNAHLAAHDEELQQRIDDYNSILDGQKFVDPQTENIITHDYAFWMGDLNFRIDDFAAQDIKQMVQDNTLQSLLDKDQLRKVMSKGEAFSEFTEPTPKFPPTYKFLVDSKDYDIESRKPAWTDRILYRLTPNAYDHVTLSLVQHHYISHPQYLQSDHKPVTSSFTVKVFDEPKEQKVNFYVLDPWHVNQDSVAWYTASQDVKVDAWDWIGLYRANFSSVDEHVYYVYASTRSSTEDPRNNKGATQDKEQVPTSSSSSSSQQGAPPPSEASFGAAAASSVQALASSLVRTLNLSPSRTPTTPNPSPSSSGSPSRSPLIQRKQGDAPQAQPTQAPQPPPATTQAPIKNDPPPPSPSSSTPTRWYSVTFADTSLLVPGTYRLLYISSTFNDVLGISDPFVIHS